MSTDLIERWSTAAQAYLDGDLRTYARHTDPLTRPIEPELFAALARGEHAVG